MAITSISGTRVPYRTLPMRFASCDSGHCTGEARKMRCPGNDLIGFLRSSLYQYQELFAPKTITSADLGDLWEEPIAGKPHTGICWGESRQRLIYPPTLAVMLRENPISANYEGGKYHCT